MTLPLPGALSAEHTIHIHGAGPGFTVDVTYNPLTVVPRHRIT